jgi:hypothetical protein
MRSVKGRATSAASPGAQGTLGGVPHTAGPPPGRVPAVLGEEVYLWILGVIAYFRTALSRYHGG